MCDLFEPLISDVTEVSCAVKIMEILIHKNKTTFSLALVTTNHTMHTYHHVHGHDKGKLYVLVNSLLALVNQVGLVKLSVASV